MVDICSICVNVDGTGEDEQSLNDHISTMAAELQKTKPSVTIITECTKRTFAHRRQQIDQGLTTPEILDIYPALRCDHQVILQFLKFVVIYFNFR